MNTLPKTNAGRIMQDALRRFPTVETKTISDWLFHKHPGLFTSTEQARAAVQARWARTKRKKRRKPKRHNMKAEADR